jgi:hypothetical protein
MLEGEDMASIIKGRRTVANERAIVVFPFGVRINRAWTLQKWLPAFRAMPRMLQELEQLLEMGLLSYHSHFGFPTLLLVQYWRSFERLATYAGNKDAAHLPAWRFFNKEIGSNGDVGIWHETYRVGVGQDESFYNNTPLRELPAVLTMARVIQQGSLHEVGQAMSALFAWIGAHGYSACGAEREVHLFGREHDLTLLAKKARSASVPSLSAAVRMKTRTPGVGMRAHWVACRVLSLHPQTMCPPKKQ